MSFDFARARVNMVENQVRTNDVTDLHVQDAMKIAPRERLCLPGRQALAYAEAPLPYTEGYWLAEPRDVSKLLQAVAPRAGERALAIAAPYAAAVMAQIGCRVTARLPQAAPAALQDTLRELGMEVETGLLDALGGADPFDVIVCEGAVERTPHAWTDALAMGGRLGVVERRGPGGKAQLYLRGGDGLIARRELFDATPHLLPGFVAERAFAL